MLRLFKNIQILCYGTALLGVVGFGAWNVMQQNSPWVFFRSWAAIIWILLCAVVFQFAAIKKMNKIIGIMNQHCHVQKFIDINNGFFEKKAYLRYPARNSTKGLRTYLLLNLSAGYLRLGDTVTAGQALASINYFPGGRIGATYPVCYYDHMFSYYLQMNNVAAAEQMLQQMKAALQNGKLRPAHYNQWFPLYNDKQFLLNMAQGNYDGCEQVFRIAFDRGKTVLDKVSAQFTLGKIYLHFDRRDEARKVFAYAAEHGGDTYYAKEAKRYLNDQQREAAAT